MNYINFNHDSSLKLTALTLEGWVRDPPGMKINETNILEGPVNSTDITFNASQFWSQFYSNTTWILEYNQSGIWNVCNTSILVYYKIIDEKTRKFSLNFTAPATGRYRLLLSINYSMTDRIYNSSENTYDLTYTIGNDFLISFNYSDIAYLPTLRFSHEIVNNKFCFSIEDTSIISSGTTISLDPQYTIINGARTNSTLYNTGRKVVRTSDGNLHCVYTNYYQAGIIYNVFCASSYDGNGALWTTQALTTGNSYHQYFPSIAVDSKDNLHVVWQGARDNTGYQIRYCEYDSTTKSWGRIQNLTTGSVSQYTPAIAVSNLDDVYVVWSGYKDVGLPTAKRQIRYTMYDASLHQWTSITNITAVSFDQFSPSIAIDKSNYVHAVWYGLPNAVTSRTAIRYATWIKGGAISLPTNLTSPGYGYDQQFPCIAIDTNSKVHVVWHGTHSGSITNRQIRYCDNTGAKWSTPTNLTTLTTTEQLDPSISIEYANKIHVVWWGFPSAAAMYYQIRHCSYTTKWSAPDNLTLGNTNKRYPNLIWAIQPNAMNVSLPITGFALVYMDNTALTYYQSTDLTWTHKVILGMTQETYSLEIEGSTLYGYIANNSVSASIDANWHYIALAYSSSGMTQGYTSI